MAEQEPINLKISYYKNSTTKTPHDIRRLRVGSDSTLANFVEQIKLQQPAIDFDTDIIQFRYKDEEDDSINFSTEEEWKIALDTVRIRKQQQGSSLLRVSVTIMGKREIPIKDVKRHDHGCKPTARHFGVICDGCNKRAFTGFRYRCQDCPDWDYCESCFNSTDVRKRHAFNHMFTKISPPAHCRKQTSPRHYGVTCDGCGAHHFMGDRHKCLSCDDYDLCDTCHKNQGVRANHYGGSHSFRCIQPANRKAPSPVVEVEIMPLAPPIDETVFGDLDAKKDVQEEPKVEQEPVQVEEKIEEPAFNRTWPNFLVGSESAILPVVEEEYQHELDQLHAMGFTDKEKNKELLRSNKGDVTVVVQSLLEN